jgi:amino acid adenylation domain-containing protein/thioester reductase-like protein
MVVSIAPEDLCLHQLFEVQARRSPQAIAVVDAQNALTYEELDRRAELLAGYLRSVGVRSDEVVGVYMERCADFVVACLATLKAGGAFLPLEMAYPASLLGEVIADAEPRIVLTHEHYAERLPRRQERLCLNEGWEEVIDGDGTVESEDEPQPGPENLIFVSYSSGTTGKPKGIANPHRAAVRSYLWRFGISDYGPGDRVGCNVFFIWEMFRPLLRGATTVVIPDDVIYDPEALVRFLEEYRITEVLMTPSLLQAVLNASGPDVGTRLSALRVLWLNGEVVTKVLAQRVLRLLPKTRVLNVYSISETHEVAAGDLRDLSENPLSTHCPVGRPMDPDHLYLLDQDMQSVPDGAAGELYIGGDALARGYVNRPELTQQRFVEDPFSSTDRARMYRSGDKARLLADGSLEVLGRVDFMVKVRGYSIELGAVEAAIEKHLAVRSCVVIAEGEEGEDKRLVAYLVPSSDPDERGGRYAGWSLDPRTGRSPEIRRRLQESLPHYAIPAVFVELEALPLQDTTGKVDRRQLPPPPARVDTIAFDPAEHAEALSADAPRHEKEDLIVRLWEDVLRLEEGDVRRDDDFFDVGGHSLAAAQLVSSIDGAFGVRLSMRAFLENPTVEGMCDEIEALQDREGDGTEADREQPVLDLRSEAVLEPDIKPEQTDTGGAATLQDARRVFLTGATGFLGAFLLDALLSRTNAEIQCLVRPHKGGAPDLTAPIRANLQRYGLWQSGHARRIVPVAGDLSKPLLGMAEDDFDALAREPDIVLHNGAVVNMIYPYTGLKPVNVDGTREVLRLACLHKTKPVHHVSTNGIFAPGTPLCREDVDLDTLAEARGDGYGQSKWVAEKLVWQAAESGLPVSVYRPGNISGHSATGASNPRDFQGALIAESLHLGCAPLVDGWRMEMTPVDFVSHAICHLAGESSALGQVFHLADPNPVSAERVFAWLEEMGYPLQRLDYPDWLEALHASPQRDADGDDVIGGILGGAAPETHELWDGNIYDDSNTRRALQGGGLRRPQLDASLFRNYVSYLMEQGWIEAPSESPNGRQTVSPTGARYRS